MNMKTQIAFRTSLIALAAIGLTGCKVAKAPEPEATASEAADGEAAEPVSIIRPEVEIERDELPLEAIDQRIPFDEGGSELSETAIEELQTVLDLRIMKAGGAITLRGHTDSAGFDEANLRASETRAQLVRDWLVEKGVAEKRITVVPMGEQNPAMPNAKPDGSPDEAARAFNRRVMVEIAVPPEVAKAQAEKPQTLVEQVSAED